MVAFQYDKRRYNILFLGFIPYIGGSEISTLLLLKYLDKEKFNPVFIIPDFGPLSDRLKELKVKVVTMPLEQAKFPFLLGYLKTVWNLTRFIKKNNIDLIICTVEICNQYGFPAARLNRIPIACHTRNLIPDFRSF
jgi:UDP-N-acetylglucosamine:LPS N-acetylglucosamine transferase|tara:strand:- start:808 stop:1215 length:408 start_codon:yes stop_codon:yes gene_type:complete